MEIKKSNFLEDRFKLSSFCADNRRYASVSSVRTGAKTHLIANQKRGYIEKYVNIIYASAWKGLPSLIWKGIRISLVEVYKRVGKSVIWVCKRAQKV